MKRSQSLRRYLATLLLLAVTTLTWAYDFQRNGIYYNKNSDGTSVSVTRELYSGSVTIPSTVLFDGETYNVTIIEVSAFRDCHGLTSVTIPESVKGIGAYAFYGCHGLTSVTIPESVKSIEYYAFYGCYGLTSVTIPNSVTSIGDYAFSGCSGLTSVTINSNDIVSKNYTSASNLGTIIANRVKEYIIGDNVESIGDYAFYGCSELTSVTIGNSVTSIGDYAFGSSGLTSVTIPESVTSIGGYVFSGCDYLSGISVNRTEPEKYNCYYSAFDNIDYNRVVLYVPKGYEKAYAQCNPWSKFPNIKEHNSNVQGKSFTLRCARGYVYGDGTKLAGTTDASQASEFAIVAYNGQTYLYDATNKAFVVHTTAAKAGTTGNPSLESKDDFLKAVTGLTWGATGYESYPYYLEDSFGNWMNMDKSSNVYMNTWKDFEGGNGGNTYAVTIVDTEFDATEAIEMLSNYYKNPMQGKSFTLRCARGYVYGDGTKLAGTNDASQVSEFAIVTYNGQTYLYDATNKAFVVHTTAAKAGTTGNPSLESKDDFSKAVTGLTWGTTGYESYPYYLEDSFGNWMNMDKRPIVYMNTWKDFEGGNGGNTYAVTIVDTEFDATEAIEMLDAYYNPVATVTYDFVKNGIYYNKNSDGTSVSVTYKTTSYNSYSGSVTIPATVTYNDKTFNVTSIGDYAFSGCPGLKSLTIPESVTSIGDYAFEGCSGLTSVTIPNSVKSIGDGAFFRCDGLTSVTIPESVTSIGRGAFQGCSGLTSLTIPNSVKSIGDSVFRGCSGLTSLTIPESVTSIGDFAFSGCSGLTSVTIPNSVTSIGDHAFSGCSGLTSVTIPNSVTSIGWSAFDGCSGLTSVTIPESVTEIGLDAFAECGSLAEIFCYAVTPPSSSNKAFEGDNLNTVTLYVPFESLKKYQTTSPWNEFGTIRVIGMFKVSYFVDGEAYQTEWLPEGETIIPATNPTKQGHTFSGWSEIPEKMPAHDVEVTGSFSINSYTLTYKVDGEEYRTSTVVYGAELTAETEPAKEGYTFSGWSEVPEKMPAHDVEITGSFSVNKYTVTFKYGDVQLSTAIVNYGEEIPLPESLDSDRYTLVEWLDVPATMPAHDITIQASFTDGVSSIGMGQQTKEPQYYDLSGRKLTRPSKGITIVNGKKVLVK